MKEEKEENCASKVDFEMEIICESDLEEVNEELSQMIEELREILVELRRNKEYWFCESIIENISNILSRQININFRDQHFTTALFSFIPIILVSASTQIIII